MAQLPEPALADGDTGTIGRDDDLIAPDTDMCPICCHEFFDRPTRTVCNHWFCLCAALPIPQSHPKPIPLPAGCVALTGWALISKPHRARTRGTLQTWNCCVVETAKLSAYPGGHLQSQHVTKVYTRTFMCICKAG